MEFLISEPTEVPCRISRSPPKLRISEFFLGKRVASIGGSFSSLGSVKYLRDLETEVQRAGYTLRPAPVKAPKTVWLLDKTRLDNGASVEVKCEHKNLEPGNPLSQSYLNVFRGRRVQMSGCHSRLAFFSLGDDSSVQF